jgi:phosphatidylserine/phosphatidylglycerophosphate/cardiolipin synthase-like enzyme
MNNFKEEIILDIISAADSIKVAVSWMTGLDFFGVLKNKKLKDKVEIIIILSDHPENRKYSDKFIELLEVGIKVFTWGTKDPKLGNFMHCKFYVIDDKFAKSGSYNWSHNASKNAECLDLVEINSKIDQFDKLLRNSIDFALI